MAETKTPPPAPPLTQLDLEKHLKAVEVAAMANAGNSPNPFLFIRNHVTPLLDEIKAAKTIDKALSDRVLAVKYVPAASVVKALAIQSAVPQLSLAVALAEYGMT